MTALVVNTHDAKSRLSELIRQAEQGVEVIVARNGHPVARIVPWKPERPARVPGAWAGEVHGSDDSVDSDDEVVAVFDESAAAGGP